MTWVYADVIKGHVTEDRGVELTTRPGATTLTQITLRRFSFSMVSLSR